MTRRGIFLLLGAALAAGGVAGGLMLRGRREPLATDPEGERFVYVDGWIVER